MGYFAAKPFNRWFLFLLAILLPITAVSCSKPSPKRVVQRYLEEISKPRVDEEKVSRYITDRYHDDLLQNALLAEIKSAKGNYFDLLTPLMSREDALIIDETYDFQVTFREYIEGSLALVKVFMKPVPKVDNSHNKVFRSETLHPLLKQTLREEVNNEFLIKLKLKEGEWKIDAVIYPAVLEKVIRDRSSATVTIPPPKEGTTDEATGEVPGDNV